VRVGTIAIRTGIPHDKDPWGWSCGFYPGSHPGDCTNGTAATFDQARADFEEAWRDARDWHAEKYRQIRSGRTHAAWLETAAPARWWPNRGCRSERAARAVSASSNRPATYPQSPRSGAC
jgi:hypothetical protein